MYGSRVAWPAGGAEAEAEPAQGRYHARCVARGRHQDQGKPGERSFAAGEPSLKPLHWQLLAWRGRLFHASAQARRTQRSRSYMLPRLAWQASFAF